MAEDLVRMYRILIYEGPREWVEGACLEERHIKGTWYPHPTKRNMRIIEAIVGEFPSTWPPVEELHG